MKPSAAVPAQQLIAVVAGNRLSLVQTDGRIAASTDMGTGAQFAGVGGGLAVYRTLAGTLLGLRPTGAVEVIATGVGPPAVGGIWWSPDGGYWLWGSHSATSRILLHRPGAADVVVDELAEEMRGLWLFRWDRGGALAYHAMSGIGWYLPWMAPTGDVDLIDIATNSSRLLWRQVMMEGQCQFLARAEDGTIACAIQTDADAPPTTTIRFIRPDGSVLAIPLAQPRFENIGAVSFKPGPTATLAVISGASGGIGLAGAYGIDIIDLAAGGDIWRLGPDGLVAGDGDWVWLDSGAIVAHKPGVPGEGTVLVHPDGSVQELAPGRPVGVLSTVTG